MDYPDSPDLFEGKFTDGDPVAGIPASVASADHMNAVYDELLNIITFTGGTPDSAVKDQLKTALEFYRNASNLNAGTVQIERLPVTQSATDNTSKRLLKVGDGGFLSNAIGIDDLNTIVVPGSYQYSGALNAPSDFGTVIATEKWGEFTYLAVDFDGNIYSRAKTNGSGFQEWRAALNDNSATIVNLRSSVTELSTANNDKTKTALNASGSAPIYACRAWVNFDGTGTVSINASGNVSSITDLGAGDYVVNFETAMEDTSYAANASCREDVSDNASGYQVATLARFAQTTSSVRVYTLLSVTGDHSDAHNCNVLIFR